MNLWRYDGARWVLEGKTGEGAGYVEKNDVVAFSPWALAENGAPTAVHVAEFSAQVEGDHVRLTWTTASEMTNLGFNLYRGATPAEPDVQLNSALIVSQAPGTTGGFIYTWEDHATLLSGPIYYWLEDVDFSQTATRHGPVRAPIWWVFLPMVVGP